MNLTTITEELSKLKAKSGILEESFSVFFLNNITVDLIRPFLEFELYQGRIEPRVQFGLYGVIHQSLMDPHSELFQAKPKVIVLSLAFDHFVPDYEIRSWQAEEVIRSLTEIYDLLKDKTSAVVMLNTFLLPFGESGRAPRTSEKIEEVNTFIRKFVAENSSRFCLADWNAYLRDLGRENAIDLRYWYLSKAPFRPAFMAKYAADLGRVSRALAGRLKKVLVLDCDNSLWGGIVGEDGLAGIKLHPSEYPGNVFYAFQKKVLALKQRGVLLCTASKNNEADVFEVFEKHPHSVLKKEDFVLHAINWNSKADNIAELSQKLNLGLDSFVFVDDSDFECHLVSERLPSVKVLQVPKKLYEYPDLFADDPFYSFGQTAEDLKKTEQYRIKAAQEKAKESFSSTSDYLASLEMEVQVRLMQKEDRARVAQLTQKTNQFNLTTKRYTEAEIERMAASKDTFIFVLNVKDRFGDMGLTNVMIMRSEGSRLSVDTNLMSCRVFERNLEALFFDSALKHLMSQHWISEVEAAYLPTPKNAVCREFWDKMGFALAKEENGARYYRLQAADYHSPSDLWARSHIRVKESFSNDSHEQGKI